MKILCIIRLPEEIYAFLKTKGEVFIKKRKDLTIEEMGTYDIIIGNVPLSLLPYANNLKYLQLESAGSDLYAPLVSETCILCNAAGTFGATIAEHLIMVTLMLFRNMLHYHQKQKEREFAPIHHVKMIHNSRFLIFGTGNLGSEYAKVVQAMGGYTIGVKRTKVDHLTYFNEVINNDEVDSYLSTVDVVCLCLPQNKDSDKILSRERLEQLRSDAIVLNVGRGNALDEKHLCELLKEKRLAGAALDVFAEEPIAVDSFLWDVDNLIITPHVSGTFANAYTYNLFYGIVKENIEHFFSNEPLRNVVDKKWGY